MSTTLLEILQHSLGVDEYGQGQQYRSYFVAGPGHDNFEQCRQLVRDGLMQEHAPREIYGNDYCFTVTPAGRKFVADNSPAPPKLTAAQKRYRRWLDADCGLTFGQFIRKQS